MPYDVMQVCLNGHQITDRYNSCQSERSNFCDKCGAGTIFSCTSCAEPIKGDFISEEIPIVPLPEELPVPSHCEGCGESYPWAKERGFNLSNLLLSFKELTMFKKFSLIGSVASIVGLSLYFLPSVSSETSIGSINQNHNSNSTSIGVNKGEITIINPLTKNTKEVHKLVRSAPILKEPDFKSIGKEDATVCSPISGTKVKMTGKVSSMGGILGFWKEVEVINGACAGKVGWTSMENIEISTE